MIAVAMAALVRGPAAAASESPPTGACDARATLQALSEARVPEAQRLAAPYASTEVSSPVCTALLKVLARLAARERSGGRKLEGDKPLDLAAAQREREAAMADAAIRGDLDPLLGREPDAARRALLEASVMHLHGHYLARDLILRSLQQGGAK